MVVTWCRSASLPRLRTNLHTRTAASQLPSARRWPSRHCTGHRSRTAWCPALKHKHHKADNLSVAAFHIRQPRHLHPVCCIPRRGACLWPTGPRSAHRCHTRKYRGHCAGLPATCPSTRRGWSTWCPQISHDEKQNPAHHFKPANAHAYQHSPCPLRMALCHKPL